MEKEKIKMNGGGRGVTEYRAEYNEQAYNYCLLGATNETLAEFFEVSATTIKKWMNKYPDFKESVRRGKDVADMEVARSLYRRAVGYRYEQVVTEYIRPADNQEEPEKVTCTVGTFSDQESDCSHQISLATIQSELAKVVRMVDTFLEEHSNGLQKTGLATIQGELKMVTNTVGTFLSEDGCGSQKSGAATTQTDTQNVTCTVGTFLCEDRNGLQKNSVATIQTETKTVTDTVRTFLDDKREGLQKIRVTTREVIPDVRAQIFWLKNRRPDLWRDKQEIDHLSGGENMDRITIFELPNDHRND